LATIQQAEHEIIRPHRGETHHHKMVTEFSLE